MHITDNFNDFNIHHPEMKDGETFLINDTGDQDAMVTYEKLNYKTKRLGDIAYTSSGEIIENARPVFVSIEEFKARINKR